MHTVLYARKSTEADDRQALSVEAQLDELREFCSREGIRIDEELVEAKSAKRPGRPVFSSLMERVHARKVGRVVCWKLDRLARNPLDGGSLIWVLGEGILQGIVTPEKTYGGTSEDKFLMSIHFGMATRYSDDLSQNIRRGQRKRVSMGIMPGPVPLGYVKRYDPTRAVPVVVRDPERFPLVRRLFELALGGTPVREILSLANDAWGLRTRPARSLGGKPLGESTIYRMLHNPFYVGLVPYKGEIHPGIHEPLVTAEEFAAVRRVLIRTVNTRPKGLVFAWSGAFRCGACGRGISPERKTNRHGTRYVYYRCSGRSRGLCREPSVEERSLDAQVLAFLEGLVVPEALVPWVLDRVKEARVVDERTAAASRTSAAEALAGVQRRLDNLVELRARGLVDYEDFRRLHGPLVLERQALRERLAASEGRRDGCPPFGEVAEMLVSLGKTLVSAFREGDAECRRAIVRAVGDHPRIAGGKVLIEAKKPLGRVPGRSSIHSIWRWRELNPRLL